jgi:hypothetical protein
MIRGGMRDEEHFIQDALELYAVARMQELAQDRGLAISADAGDKLAAFLEYAASRGFTMADFDSGRWKIYKETYDRHLPVFIDRLVTTFPGQSFDFTNTEVENRNAQLKGDFLITTSDGLLMSVSLKNYRGGALRPQLNSGTYNSFMMNFMFESPGVGSFLDPTTGRTFRGTPPAARDAALRANGYEAVVPYMAQLDQLNVAIRARFIDTPEFDFLDEEVFDHARKECGAAGAAVAVQILTHIDPPRLKARALKMVGMDGAEEMLLMDPAAFTDTITNPVFRALRDTVQHPSTALRVTPRGQGIALDFVNGERVLLEVYVPFTINKNGAWISGDPYEGVKLHVKEGRELAYGQRRPKKSRELATSINTYVNFGTSGIFGPAGMYDE